MVSNSNWINRRFLNIICGCMFAGKTEELIRRVNVLRKAQKKVIVFFSKISERYRVNQIVTHNNRFIDAHPVNSVQEVEKYLQEKDFDAVCFDEIQFFTLDFYQLILRLVTENKYIICAGIDKDYWNQNNGLMAKLLVRADNVDKLCAICARCNNVATRTQRVNTKREAVNTYQPKILIGGAKRYEARCNKCFVEFHNPWTQ